MILYGYDINEGVKFEVPMSIEKICQTINDGGIFSDYEYVYTTEEDRDFHFNENVKEKTND